MDMYLEGYNTIRRRFLFLGFSQGFKLHANKPTVSVFANYHQSVQRNPHIVSTKLSIELQAGRIAGPFVDPPFPVFVVSPIGLVPKKEAGAFRVIHDLSYLHNSHFSINETIPTEYCSVKYETLDNVIDLVLQCGRNSLIAKADVQSAFRLLPISPSEYCLLGFQHQNNYYYDKRLPMGASTSCATFEELSKALQWILQTRLGVTHVSHILDDFIFISSANSSQCQASLAIFLQLAEQLHIPINHNKTVNPTTCVTVHGVELDTEAMIARLPQDKLVKAQSELTQLLLKKKVTLHQLQSVIGFLNFACLVVKPGRAFLRRLIDLTKGLKKPHHHVRLTREARRDIKAWLFFVQHHNGISILMRQTWSSSHKLALFTDSAKSSGFAAVFGNNWVASTWDQDVERYHITLLEMYPIILALYIWGPILKNKCILFFTDNSAVADILNDQTSKDPSIMVLVRQFVLLSMKYNILFKLKHIPGHQNKLADALSRSQIEYAFSLQTSLHVHPEPVPQHLTLSRLMQHNSFQVLCQQHPSEHI